jgi:hypothetical protein
MVLFFCREGSLIQLEKSFTGLIFYLKADLGKKLIKPGSELLAVIISVIYYIFEYLNLK